MSLAGTLSFTRRGQGEVNSPTVILSPKPKDPLSYIYKPIMNITNKVIIITLAGVLVVGVILYWYQTKSTINNPPIKLLNNNMQLTTTFATGQPVPIKYTCDGADINPSLQISDLPANTESIAIIVDDPDSPSGDWVHWVMWNISPAIAAIAENSVPAGAVVGVNDFGKNNYGGPCPHGGVHRYFFKVYALDKMLDLPASATKADLLAAMSGHILGDAQVMGVYQR